MTRARTPRLAALLEQIQRQWGAHALQFAPTLRPVAGGATVGTGFAELDAALGGGLPLGRSVALCGAPTAGATTLALHILARAHAEGLAVAYLDLTGSFDPLAAARCGVDLGELLVAQPARPSEALAMAQALLASRAVELVVLDDTATLAADPRAAPQLAGALDRLRPTLTRTGGGLILRCPPPGERGCVGASADVWLSVERTGWLWEHELICGYLASLTIRRPPALAERVVPLRFEIGPLGE